MEAASVLRTYILLTYPQCDIELRCMRDILKERTFLEGNIEYMVIAAEDHHDTEGVHRHVFIKLKHRMRFSRDDIAWRFDLCRRFSNYGEGESNVHYDSWQHYRDLWFIDHQEAPKCGEEVVWVIGEVGGTLRRWHPNFECPDGRRNSPKNMWIYTRKDHNYIEDGIINFKDEEAIRNEKAERNKRLLTVPLQQLVESGEVSILAIPQLKKARQTLLYEYTQNEIKEIKVYWFYGETGSGKSYAAREEAKRGTEETDPRRAYWVSNCSTKSSAGWFDGYYGQPTAIFDDLRANTLEFNTLLQITDVYQDMQVPIKGGFIRWNPSKVIITSPSRPEDVFRNYTTGEQWDHIDQLLRRITEIRRFWKDEEKGYCSELENL